MFNRILVATDFSDASEKAISRAVALGSRGKAAVGLCHVAPEPVPPGTGVPDWLKTMAPDKAESDTRAKEAMDRVAETLRKEGVDDVTSYLGHGDPYAAIVRRAEVFNADLLIVGSHGRTGLARMLLGSVAEKVVRYAPCPVLVARQGPEAGPIVTTTDFSDVSKVGMRMATQEAEKSGDPLVAIHVLDMSSPAGLTYSINIPGMASAFEGTDVQRELSVDLQKTLAEVTSGARINASAEVFVGDPAMAVVHRAEDLKARLIVVSTHGRTGLQRMLMGSVAEKIVRHAHTSVLAVRPVIRS